MGRLKTIFLGTPDFSVPTLQSLHQSIQVEVCLVISMPDRPAGRGHQLHSPEVIQYAKAHQLPFYQSSNINNDQDLINLVTSLQPDVLVVLAFAQFLNKKWLNIAHQGVFNIHTSILPKYRGAAPIQAAILNGDSQTGVCIQRMVSKMDAGDVVLKILVDISPDMSAHQLASILSQKAAESVLVLIDMIQKYNLVFYPQDESEVSFAPIIKKDDGLLNFSLDSAYLIYRKWLAYMPWPGIFFFLNKKRVKILELKISNKKLEPSTVFIDELVHIGCQEGSLTVLSAQPEGKKPMSSIEFRQWILNQKTLTIEVHP